MQKYPNTAFLYMNSKKKEYNMNMFSNRPENLIIIR